MWEALLPWQSVAVLGVVAVVLIIAVLLLAKWGVINREMLQDLVRRAEGTEGVAGAVLKSAFKEEFDAKGGVKAAVVKNLVAGVDPKKLDTREGKGKRFFRFLGNVALDLVPGVRR
jgi:hypothetical protein